MNQIMILLTDSGCIQEETPGLGKLLISNGKTIERPKAMDADILKLAGTNYDLIISETLKLLEGNDYYK